MAKVGCQTKTKRNKSAVSESGIFSKEFSTFKCLSVPTRTPWKSPNCSLSCKSWNGPEIELSFHEKSRLSGFVKNYRIFNLCDEISRPILHLKMGEGPVLWVKNAQNGTFMGSIRKEDDTQDRLSCLDNKGRDYFRILLENEGKKLNFVKAKDSSTFASGTVMKVQKKSGLYYDVIVVDFIHSNTGPDVTEDKILQQSLLVSSLFFLAR